MPRTTRTNRRRLTGAFAVTIVGALLLVACGDDDPSTVEAAQQRVTKAEQALADAQAQFCDDSKDYITAVDRYGNVIVESAATVGDVTTAGKDLEEPRKEVESSINDVVDARDELTAATAALAEARSSTTDADAPPTTLLPPATVERAAQAEDDLASATSGITADTPLAKAGAVFNAAAFALEVSWLRVFADAGCLTDDQHKAAVDSVAQYTITLQQSLTTAKYYTGKVDGVYGPETVEAVEKLQAAEGLPETGYVDKATSVALDAAVLDAGGEASVKAVAQTGAVQSILKLAGHWDGPVDGKWTPELTAALQAFQTELGVPASGVVDPATLAAVEAAAKAARETTTTMAPTSSSTTTTEAPTTTAAP